MDVFTETIKNRPPFISKSFSLSSRSLFQKKMSSIIPKSVYEAPESSQLPLRKIIKKEKERKEREENEWASLVPDVNNSSEASWDVSFDISNFKSQIIDDKIDENVEKEKKKKKKKINDEATLETIRLQNLQEERKKNKEREEKIKSNTHEAFFPKVKMTKRNKKKNSKSNEENDNNDEDSIPSSSSTQRLSFFNTPFLIFIFVTLFIGFAAVQYPQGIHSLQDFLSSSSFPFPSSSSSSSKVFQLNEIYIVNLNSLESFIIEKNKIGYKASQYEGFLYFDALKIPQTNKENVENYEVLLYFKSEKEAEHFLNCKEYLNFRNSHVVKKIV